LGLVAGFSIDNLSLMALAVSVGFVVDDAIVMIENTFRNLERGMSPMRAAIASARQISFHRHLDQRVARRSIHSDAVHGRPRGRMFREFSVTLVFAITISTFASLSVTPMICARFLRETPGTGGELARGWFDRLVENALAAMLRRYGMSLQFVLRHQFLTLAALAATMALTVYMYIHTPKGFFPPTTAASWRLRGASQDISFQQMTVLVQRAAEIVQADPVSPPSVPRSAAAPGAGRSITAACSSASSRPPSAAACRRQPSSTYAARSRRYTGPARLHVAGAAAALPGRPCQPIAIPIHPDGCRYGGIVVMAAAGAGPHPSHPGIIDVTTDRQLGGLQANVVIDRSAASRLGIQVQDIDNALNNAFSQRQISTVFTQRNQYRVILEIDPQFQQDPANINRVFVGGGTAQGRSSGATQVPLAAVARVEKSNTPLSVNHQSQYPAATVTWNLTADTPLETAANAVMQAMAEMHCRIRYAPILRRHEVLRESAASQDC